MLRLAVLAGDRLRRAARPGRGGVLAQRELVPAGEAAVPGPCPEAVAVVPVRAYVPSGSARSACVTVSGRIAGPETVTIMVPRIPARR